MKILCAVDGSSYSRWALDAISCLGVPPASSLLLMHAVNIERFRASAGVGKRAESALRTGLRLAEQGGRALLERSQATVASTCKVVASKIIRGHPAEAITRTALRHDIDLIIVGSRGLTEFRPFLLGSVSRRVVMHAPCSVLVVKKPLNGLNRIVVATDGSKDARGAIEFLLRLPLSKEVAVTLVSVVPPLPIETGHESESLAGVLEQVREPLEAQARAVAAQAAQRVREAGFQAAVVVSHGHIGHRIVELAESTHADLVVVGSRGLTGMTRYLMGSVSDAVVKYAACPVLVFRR